jgi:hypothetical protein
MCKCCFGRGWIELTGSIVGLSDGLTVPFALTAGLSGLGSSRLVVTGGLAELCAGAISMGLGGYCKCFDTSLRSIANGKWHHKQRWTTTTTSVAKPTPESPDHVLAKWNVKSIPFLVQLESKRVYRD